MNTDRLNHVAPKAVAQGALDMLDRISDENPETQGAALAVTLLAYARRRGIDVGDLFTVANNVLHSKHQETQSFQALHLYMQHEIH